MSWRATHAFLSAIEFKDVFKVRSIDIRDKDNVYAGSTGSMFCGYGISAHVLMHLRL